MAYGLSTPPITLPKPNPLWAASTLASGFQPHPLTPAQLKQMEEMAALLTKQKYSNDLKKWLRKDL